MLYSVVLASAIQQHEAAIRIHISPFHDWQWLDSVIASPWLPAQCSLMDEFRDLGLCGYWHSSWVLWYCTDSLTSHTGGLSIFGSFSWWP